MIKLYYYVITYSAVDFDDEEITGMRTIKLSNKINSGFCLNNIMDKIKKENGYKEVAITNYQLLRYGY